MPVKISCRIALNALEFDDWIKGENFAFCVIEGILCRVQCPVGTTHSI